MGMSLLLSLVPVLFAEGGQPAAENRVELTTTDGVRLEARLARPPQWKPDRGAVVLCHPHPLYGGSMDNAMVVRIARTLAAAGFATLRFNFRGVGESGGQYGGGEKEVADVLAAVERLSGEGVPESRLAIVGYSFGAAVGAAALHSLPATVAYAGVALPVDRTEIATRLRGLLEPGRPVLLVGAAQDEIAPPKGLLDLALARGGLTHIVVVGNADHFFTGPEHRQAVCEAVVQFLRASWSGAQE
ncbi:MAG: alpha/beta fold hydrolase [Armatimonadetes bacterium]|nr:alpha/beta fold hydrolase [Armatimonadota bacterium]